MFDFLPTCSYSRRTWSQNWRLNLVFCFAALLFFSQNDSSGVNFGLRNLLGEPRPNTQQIILSCGLFVHSQFWHLLSLSRLASGLKMEVSLSMLGWSLWFLSFLLSTQSLLLLCLFTCPWALCDHYSHRIWGWGYLVWVVVMVFGGCGELNLI